MIIRRDSSLQRAILLALVVTVALLTSATAQEAKPAKEPLRPGLIRGPSAEIAQLVDRGRGLRNQGDRNAALAVFEDALQKARAAGDKPGEAWAMNNIASVYRYEGTDKRAAEYFQRATALYEQARAFAVLNKDTHNTAYATLYLGVLAEQRGEVDQAIKLLETALPLFKEVDDPYYAARTCVFLGNAVLRHKHDPEKALSYFEQALPLFREVARWSDAAAVIPEMQAAYEQLARKATQPPRPKDDAPGRAN